MGRGSCLACNPQAITQAVTCPTWAPSPLKLHLPPPPGALPLFHGASTGLPRPAQPPSSIWQEHREGQERKPESKALREPSRHSPPACQVSDPGLFFPYPPSAGTAGTHREAAAGAGTLEGDALCQDQRPSSSRKPVNGSPPPNLLPCSQGPGLNRHLPLWFQLTATPLRSPGG